MEKNLEKVSLVRCSSYDQKKVDKAVERALKLAGIEIPKNKKVLIKPNVVGVFKTSSVPIITHPVVIEAVCKLLKKNNCKIFIGDSSFINTGIALKKLGIERIAKKYGKLVVFDKAKKIKIIDSKAKVLKSFYIPKIIKDVDVVINMPKLKTHQLTRATLGIKNLFGCIPGDMKRRLHRKAPNEKKFSQLLVDIYQNIKPEINIMDGIVGMEGTGPSAGPAVKSGYILASQNTISLDIACSRLMGFKPRKIFTIKYAVKRNLGKYKFYLATGRKLELKKIPNLKFKKPNVAERISGRLAAFFIEKPIVVDEKKICAQHCPVKAIILNPYPVIDKKKCIRCFCCIEICPENALGLKE